MVYNYGPLLISLLFVAVVVTAPLFAWHVRRGNVAALSLLAWILVLNLFSFVSACMFSGRDWSKHNGRGFCDLFVKLQITSNLGVSCAVAAVTLLLYRIISSSSLLLRLRRHRVVEDVLLCWTTPAVVMSLHYLVQDTRYVVFRCLGCQYLVARLWLLVVLTLLLLLLWAVVLLVVLLLALACFLRNRRDARDLLHCTNSGMTVARFSRLLIFCFLVVLVMVPILAYFFSQDAKGLRLPYRFKDVHNSLTWGLILHADMGAPFYDRWVWIGLAYALFMVLGTGADSLAMYRLWVVAVVGADRSRYILEWCGRAWRRTQSRTESAVDPWLATHSSRPPPSDSPSGGSFLLTHMRGVPARAQPPGAEGKSDGHETADAWLLSTRGEGGSLPDQQCGRSRVPRLQDYEFRIEVHNHS